MGDERAGDTLSTPSLLTLREALLELSSAACLDGHGGGADLADRKDDRAGCREGRVASVYDGALPGSEERVEAAAPSRREALHVDTGWGAVSVPDSRVPPAAAPRPGALPADQDQAA